MPGLIADLSVAARLALRAMGRRMRSRSEPAPDLDRFRSGLQEALDAAPAGLIADYAWVDMPASQPPWVDSGLSVSAGEDVSYFIEGRVVASQALDLCRRGQAAPAGLDYDQKGVYGLGCPPAQMFDPRFHIHDDDFVPRDQEMGHQVSQQ